MESFASGRAIVRDYKKFARDIKSKRAWRQIAGRMSRGFLAVVPIVQPDVIIIGGSVSTYFERYGEFLSEILTDHLPPHIHCQRLFRPKHPEEAVVYGCYYYGKRLLGSCQNYALKQQTYHIYSTSPLSQARCFAGIIMLVLLHMMRRLNYARSTAFT